MNAEVEDFVFSAFIPSLRLRKTMTRPSLTAGSLRNPTGFRLLKPKVAPKALPWVGSARACSTRNGLRPANRGTTPVGLGFWTNYPGLLVAQSRV